MDVEPDDIASSEPLQTDCPRWRGTVRDSGDLPQLACPEGCFAAQQCLPLTLSVWFLQDVPTDRYVPIDPVRRRNPGHG